MKINNQKLDLLMAERCLTSEALAQLTGISQETLARLRRGVQKPRPVTVGKIARALCVPVSALIDNSIPSEQTIN